MPVLPVQNGFAPSISVSGQTPRTLRFLGGGREENVETAPEPSAHVSFQKSAAGKREVGVKGGMRRRGGGREENGTLR